MRTVKNRILTIALLFIATISINAQEYKGQEVTAMDISDDGKYIALVEMEDQICYIDPTKRTQVKSFIKILDAVTKKQLHILPLNHTTVVSGIQISPNNKHIALAAQVIQGSFLTMANRKAGIIGFSFDLKTQFPVLNGIVNSSCNMVFINDQDIVVLMGADVCILDITTAKIEDKFSVKGEVAGIAIDEMKQHIFVSGDKADVLEYEIGSKKLKNKYSKHKGSGSSSELAIGEKYIISGRGSSVGIWEMGNTTLKSSIDIQGKVKGVALNEENNKLAVYITKGFASRVELYDLNSTRKIGSVDVAAGPGKMVVDFLTENHMAYSSRDGVRVYDIEAEKIILTGYSNRGDKCQLWSDGKSPMNFVLCENDDGSLDYVLDGMSQWSHFAKTGKGAYKCDTAEGAWGPQMIGVTLKRTSETTYTLVYSDGQVYNLTLLAIDEE